MIAPHPAKFSDRVLTAMAAWLPVDALVLDPFAGTGKLAEIGHIHAVCVEIEPEWSTGIVGDALKLPFPAQCFDAIATSPCYGNRMADHHDAKDASRRHTYRHTLGRPLHRNNTGQLQWGPMYRDFHKRAWKEADRVLKPGGRFVLNISDHWRKGRIARVSAWHLDNLEALGYRLIAEKAVTTPRNRHGANGDLRVDHETVAVFHKPEDE